MSSYREHSFDPNAWEPQGPPARPYNQVQWIGAAFGGLAVVAFLVDVAGQLGWVPHYFGEDSTWIVVLCGCMAVLLVNSRRAPATSTSWPARALQAPRPHPRRRHHRGRHPRRGRRHHPEVQSGDLEG